MKTTVEIADPLFHRAKQFCSENGISLRELVETGIRATLDPTPSESPFRLKPFGFMGKGQSVTDWATIREMAYEGRGGDKPKIMIAVDTNILVYAHRKESPWHKKAAATLIRLAEGPAPWAIPWPCVHEFFCITTHPRIYVPPTPPKIALNDLQIWFDSPSLRLLAEPVRYWEVLREILRTSAVAGPMVHDARIAAICRAHGVTTLLSADRDFSRFGIEIINPLTSQ